MNKNIAYYIILATDALYVVLAILVLCIHGVNDWSGFALTVSLGLLGVMCGWVVGFLTSPTDKAEEAALGRYAKTISTFLSGYVADKIGNLITKVTSIEFVKSYLLSDTIHSLRTIIVSYCFLSGALLMYVSRSYFNTPPISEKAEPEKPQEAKPPVNAPQADTLPAKQGMFPLWLKNLFNGLSKR